MSDGITRCSHDGFGNFVTPGENTTPIPTAPAPTPEVQFNPDSGRVVRSTTREDGSTQADSAGVTRMDGNELFRKEGGGILSTAVNGYGRPVSGKEITKDSIVTGPGGMTLTAQGAVHAGLLKVDEQGNFSELSAADQAAPGTQPEAPDTTEGFAPVQERELAALSGALAPEVHQEIIAAQITGRELTPAQLHDWGASIGLSPDQFKNNLDGCMDAFRAQANEAVASLGVTPAACSPPRVITTFRPSLVNSFKCKSKKFNQLSICYSRLSLSVHY